MFISNLLPDEIINSYLDMLCYKNWKKFEPYTIIISAHPDDETIGLGGTLKKISNAVFVYITNGAPKNPYFFSKAGFSDAESYSKARKNELYNALAIADFRSTDCIFLDIPDQESAFNIPAIVKELTNIFGSHEPDLVLTHPYEGGHPDHDSTALSVHMALQNNLRNNGYAPVALEFTSYFGENGEIATNKFLEMGSYLQRGYILSENEQNNKKQMLNCFESQIEFLKIFSLEKELFRQIPDYDFTLAPHEGILFYENFDWGITGKQWREYAKNAIAQFGFTEK